MKRKTYNKDKNIKFQVKFLHEGLRLPFALIAAIQGTSRKAAYYRYKSITDEIDVYFDVREEYNKYVTNIENAPWDGVFKFKIVTKYQ